MKTASGLKFRLIKLQLTVTLIVLTISWSFVTVNDYKIFKRLSIHNFETTGSVLARNLSTCLAFNDKEECQRVLRTLSGEDNVIKALVFNKDNELVSTFERKTFPFTPAEFDLSGEKFRFQIMDDTIYSFCPVFEGANLEGKLLVIYEFDLVSTFIETHAAFFLLVLFGCTLIGIVLAIHFQRTITLQISTILKTIYMIKTQKNYKLRTVNEFAFKDLEIEEFKQLALSFDDMLEQIDSRDASLRMRNEDLKKLVDEKVQELYREKEKAIHNAELASLGEMAGGIAHEINNPLAIIKSSTMAMSKILSKDHFEKTILLECVNHINVTVERMAKIVSGLRNISRRSDESDKVNCTFKEIFDDVLGVTNVKFNSKGVEIRKKYTDEQLSRSLLVNRIQISQVLVNLLNNAFDAVSEIEDKWIEVMLGFPDQRIELRITDSGKGIPPHVRDKMFNPFYTTKEIGKGTGIGLSISKSMIEKNGGTFFYDEQSSNTSFVIQLPIDKS